MTNLLIVLACITPLALYAVVTKGRGKQKTKYASMGLALAFLYFSAGHFFVTDDLIQMLPPWVPQRTLIIYATGGLELLIAVGLFSARWRRPAAAVAASVLVLFFPANIYAAINHTGVGAHQIGPAYLLVRTPVQLFLLAWASWPLVWPHSRGNAAIPSRPRNEQACEHSGLPIT